MSVQLPDSPTLEDLKSIEEYLKFHKESINKQKGIYQDKIEIAKGMFIFKHKQNQNKSDNWYFRFYVGDRKYKVESLRTERLDLAKEMAMEKWFSLKTHVDKGGDVFEKPVEEYLVDYVKHLEKRNALGDGIKKTTLVAKKTSLKKLKTKLKPFNKPSDIKPNFLRDYVEWRRTALIEGGNWDKEFHKNNFEPPTNHTMYKEICDFRGFFEWLKEENIYLKEVTYPHINLDYSKMKEKNPSWIDDDWTETVYWTRTWKNIGYTLAGEIKRRELEKSGYSKEEIIKKIGLYKRGRFGKFYRKVWIEMFKILGSSGCRLSELLKLQWQDIKYEIGRKRTRKDGTVDIQELAEIRVPPDTKSGTRLVLTGAGVYFRRVNELYKKETGQTLKPTDYIFRNVGTDNSRADNFIGKPLSNSFMRKMFYEMMDEMRFYKGTEFTKNYTIHSARAYYINMRLESGIPPAVVGKLVGHNLKTMMKHYENINVMNLKSKIVQQRRKKLEEADFQTFDIDKYHLIKDEI